jgi:hypothetical protein
MRLIDKQSFIRQKAQENAVDPSGGKILWSRHAVAALVDDELSRFDLEVALQHSHVIEDYPPAHRPLPDCLILAFISVDRPIHAVIAIDDPNDRIFIVTVYIPTDDRWEDEWRMVGPVVKTTQRQN